MALSNFENKGYYPFPVKKPVQLCEYAPASQQGLLSLVQQGTNSDIWLLNQNCTWMLTEMLPDSARTKEVELAHHPISALPSFA